jgi:threonine dehydrogenase-like Zn-dependent dehydrogenase
MNGRLVALVGPETTEIQEYELPAVPGGAALLKVRRANVCGSDLHIHRYLNPALRDIVLGHEFVAEIAELGDGLTVDSSGEPVAVGDRVVVVYFYTCLKCASCNRGDFNQCTNSVAGLASPPSVAPHFHGAFSTHYYLAPGQYFYKVPEEVSDAAVAGANCGLAQVMFAIDQIGVRRADTVVVQGAGGLGLYACAVARSSGARVIVVEKDPVRIKAAQQFGAHDVIDMEEHPTVEARLEELNRLTAGRGADYVIEVSGRSVAFLEAIGFARVGGGIASVGNLNVGPEYEVSIAPAVFTRKNLRVHGYLRYDPWFLQKSVKFIADHQDEYPFDSMSDRTYTIDEIEEALARSKSGEVARAAVIPA